MQPRCVVGVTLACAALAAFVAPPGMPREPEGGPLDTRRVEQLTGVKVTPPMGLTAWAAFTRAGDHTMVVGDMTLLEDQVNPVIDAALANGLAVPSIHNHIQAESPRMAFLHCWGVGPALDIAKGLKAALAAQRREGPRSCSHGLPGCDSSAPL